MTLNVTCGQACVLSMPFLGMLEHLLDFVYWVVCLLTHAATRERSVRYSSVAVQLFFLLLNAVAEKYDSLCCHAHQ